MTLKQALGVRLTIAPGNRIRTPGGWVRSDRVLVGGCEIGSIQTRRGCQSLEVITLAGRGQIAGYDVDWLVAQAEVIQGDSSTHLRRPGAPVDRRAWAAMARG
jgi:hypothetical protein